MKERIKLFEKYFNGKKTKQSDAIIKYQNEDINNVLKRSETFIGVNVEELAQPLVIVTPFPFFEGGTVKYQVVELEDGENRVDFDQSLVTTIYLSSENMFFYEANVNHTTGIIDFDYVGEFSLFDVTNTETYITYDDLVNPKVRQLVLRLHLVNGYSNEFILRVQYLDGELIQEELILEEEQKVINTIKDAIRNSKQL